MNPQLPLNVTAGVFEPERSCNASRRNAVGPYVLCAFVGSLSVLIMCGNLLVITSVVYFKKLHTPTNYLILSLAVTDLLVGVFLLPFSAVLSVGPRGPVGTFLCSVRNTFDVFLCASSIFNLCCISVDRYYAVCRPLAYGANMTVRAALVMILTAWTASALLAVAITLRRPDPGRPAVKCQMFQVETTAVPGAIFAFYIPALVIISVYLKIFTVAHRQARRLRGPARSGGGGGPAVSRTERKATKTLAIVVGVFLLSWSPFFLSMSFYPLSRSAALLGLIEAFKWFGWSNSLLNPLVYAFLYRWFRAAFKLIVSVEIFRQDLSNSKLS